ncbi:MAG: hypothetical protein IKO47_12945 [Ruminococcus sp.]|nr:hypothetical protein [Ruminococcus sp.]
MVTALRKRLSVPLLLINLRSYVTIVKDFKGTVLIVSHEPEFYMDIADNIWNIEEWSTR